MEEIEIERLDFLIPKIAKDEKALEKIKEEITHLKTNHCVYVSDSRNLDMLSNESVHLILTSPPYWNLKDYNEAPDQLGHINDYQLFLKELDKVWNECFKKLIIGGRMIIVVGDVLLSRKETGRHRLIPLHADLQVRCQNFGFDNLAPIFWHKISNATFEVAGNTKFLGKPYEPNGIIKHDMEYILMLRKPGGYRKPSYEQRRLSIISEVEFSNWYKQIWQLNGASTKNHPAPFPEELAHRLVKMFSFVGDTVLDPFAGSGTTLSVCSRLGRDSIGVEIDEVYAKQAKRRIEKSISLYNSQLNIELKNLKSNDHSIAGNF